MPFNNDRTFLRPIALMHDTCIVPDRESTFHMVWTVGWHEKGIGYSHSKDLIHWSEQKYIPVMAPEEERRIAELRNYFMMTVSSSI